MSDPLNLFSGMPTEPVGPFGLPVPSALATATEEAEFEEADAADEAEPTADDAGPLTTDDHPESVDAAVSKLREAAERGQGYIDTVEEAMDEETCEMCRAILDNLRSRPLEVQVQGVRELAELKAAAAEGADPIELAEVMEDFEVVDDPENML